MRSTVAWERSRTVTTAPGSGWCAGRIPLKRCVTSVTPVPNAACSCSCFFFQAEDGIRDDLVTGVQTCALPISHHRDRAIKLPRYAAAGVPEAWIVDLDGECVEVCRDLVGGRYRERRRVPRGETVAPETFPDVTLEVADILG